MDLCTEGQRQGGKKGGEGKRGREEENERREADVTLEQMLQTV